MMPSSRTTKFMAGMIGMSLISIMWGCATPQEQVVRDCVKSTCLAQQDKAPRWILESGQVFSGDTNSESQSSGVVYGVGNASGIRQPGLLRRSAEGQARRQVAEFLETDVEALLEQYYASTAANGGEDLGEQDIQDLARQLTKQTVNGISIVEYWENPYLNEAYALARWDIDRFDALLEKLAEQKGLTSEVAQVIRKNKEDFAGKMEALFEKRGK